MAGREAQSAHFVGDYLPVDMTTTGGGGGGGGGRGVEGVEGVINRSRWDRPIAGCRPVRYDA